MTARRYLLLVFAAAVIGTLIYAAVGRDRAPAPPADAGAADTTAADPRLDPRSDVAAAAHILVAHAESDPPIEGVTRTKAEALERAARIGALVQSRQRPFAELAREYSDAPGVARSGGYLGIYRRGELPLALEVPLFDLEENAFDVDVVSPRGVHILMRLPVRRAVGRHILIAWEGVRLAAAGVTRTRAQAELLADEVLAMLATGEVDFCDLAGRFSDDPDSRFECGLIGGVEPADLPANLETELFALSPGEVSTRRLESEFGFHILMRAE